MPYKKDPKIDYRRLKELAQEFTEHWEKLHALYLDASTGFFLVTEEVKREQELFRSQAERGELNSDEFLDSTRFSHRAILGFDFCASSIHLPTKGEVKKRNSNDGANFVTLGQLCIVSFDTYWNEYLRKEYVIAKGHLEKDEPDKNVIEKCLRDYGSNDLWGDIRKIRNSIVHRHGIASSEISQCKIIKWFAPGDPIIISLERMRLLFLALLQYRNNLDKEQHPPFFIQLPASPDGNK